MEVHKETRAFLSAEVPGFSKADEAAIARAATALLEEEDKAAEAIERAKQQRRAKKARQKLRKQVRCSLWLQRMA